MSRLKTSTQNFTKIKDIKDDVVIFDDNRACVVVELSAVNFSLLSPQEQDAKIFAYAGLLNSLSFPIQIVIRSKRLDISSYLRLLDEEAKKEGDGAVSQISKYREFVANLVKVNTILDKRFYVVIYFSFLEKVASLGHFEETAKANLHSKASSLASQLARLNLKTRTLGREELIKLYYDFYNEK